MPHYSKLHDLISHRVSLEYDTGARIVGYLALCRPSSGPVEFVKLTHAELITSGGEVLERHDELSLSPNVLTSFSLDEGPRGRDVEDEDED